MRCKSLLSASSDSAASSRAAIGDQLRQPRGDLAHRQDEVGEARRDGAARHRAVFGLLRVLHQDDAAGLLDRPDPDRAVRSRAAEDDGEVVAPLRGERTEKQVDRRPPPARLVEFGERQVLVGDEQLTVGRDDIDMARLEAGAAGHLGDRHFGARREDRRQFALMLRVEMDDDDEGGVHLVGQALEERLQRMHAAGRGADADGRKPLGRASSGASAGQSEGVWSSPLIRASSRRAPGTSSGLFPSFRLDDPSSYGRQWATLADRATKLKTIEPVWTAYFGSESARGQPRPWAAGRRPLSFWPVAAARFRNRVSNRRNGAREPQGFAAGVVRFLGGAARFLMIGVTLRQCASGRAFSTENHDVNNGCQEALPEVVARLSLFQQDLFIFKRFETSPRPQNKEKWAEEGSGSASTVEAGHNR